MWRELKYWWSTKSSGLLRLAEDVRDLDFADIVGASEEYQSPNKEILLDPIYEKDQVRRENYSSNAWSRTYAIYFGEDISVRWIVAKEWQQGWCNKGGGADMRMGAKIGQKFGLVLESELPTYETMDWDEYVNIDFDKYDKIAEQRKIGSYYRIHTIGDLLKALDLGYAVAVGRDWLTSMNQGGGFKAPWIIRRLGMFVGGHATCIVGKKEIATEKVTTEANSYSKRWGDNGLFYCPIDEALEADFKKYGAFAISHVPYTPKEVKINLLTEIAKLYQQLFDLLKKKA